MAWSQELRSQTRQFLEKMDFIPHEDKLFLKRESGALGYIEIGDWLQQIWIVHQRDCDEILLFDSIDDLVEAGWVVR